MPTTQERTDALCQEIVAQLRALVVDAEADLTPEERRAVIEIALEVERRGVWGRAASPDPP